MAEYKRGALISDVEAGSWLGSIVTVIREVPISPEFWDEVLASLLARTGAQVGLFIGLINGNGYGHCDGDKGAIVARGAQATPLCPEIVSCFSPTTQSLGQSATFEIELRDVAELPEARPVRWVRQSRADMGVQIAREGRRCFALSLIRSDLKIARSNRTSTAIVSDNLHVSNGRSEIYNPVLGEKIYRPSIQSSSDGSIAGGIAVATAAAGLLVSPSPPATATVRCLPRWRCCCRGRRASQHPRTG